MADNIKTKDRLNADLDIAAKEIGGIKFPRNILTKSDGTDIDAASEATLAALNVIANAIKTAVEAMNAKTTAVNTGSIGGTVALDAPTLAALESITASTGGLTNAEMRAAPVPVSAAALPLPTGASTEATLAAVLAKMIAGPATEAKQDALIAKVSADPATQTTLAAILAKIIAAPATEAKQDAGNATLAVLDADLTAIIAQASSVLTTYNVAGVIAINTVLATIDCQARGAVSIQCVAMGATGAVTPEWSNDNVTWVGATLFTPAGASATTFNAAGLWVLPVSARYLRLRLSTATTAGTTTLSVQALQQRSVPWLGTQPVSGTVTATVANATQLPVTPTTTFTNSAATTNANTTKASAGTVWSVFVNNTNAAARFLKLYNKASAPTVGTDIPVMTIPIPAGGFVQVDPGSNGIRFSTGIAWALTGAAADADTTAVSAGEHKVAISFT